MKTRPTYAHSIGKNPLAIAGPAERPAGMRNAQVIDRNRSSEVEYKRLRDLPRLIALWPREVRDNSADATLRIIAKLRQALRAERRRGLAGHWSYDLERHLSLARAIKAEIASLEDKGRRSARQGTK